MNSASFNSQVDSVELIGSNQWGLMQRELGQDMLLEFIDEYFIDLQQFWVEQADKALTMDEKSLRSAAHKYAGTAGTMGLSRLRQSLLNIEHLPDWSQLREQYHVMLQVLAQSKAYVDTHRLG